jgi:hypothetical protein
MLGRRSYSEYVAEKVGCAVAHAELVARKVENAVVLPFP